MDIVYYPDKNAVLSFMEQDEPLIALISFDGGQMIISGLDTGFEHHILLAKAGFPESSLNEYFRIILGKEGADWTFVCPEKYRAITRKDKRIERFFKDGMTVIPQALKEIGYDVPIEIPKRYRRHSDMMGDGGFID